MNKSGLFIFTAFFIAVACNAQNAEINAKLAHTLALLALRGTPNEGGALELNPDSPENGFFIMQGTSGQSNFGWFAVNAGTGDVWNLGGSNCERLSNPSLQVEQEKIRKRFGDVKAYERLHRLKPNRIYDLEPCGSPP